MSSFRLKIQNTTALLFMIIMNTLAITLPIGGKTTGELSDLYPNLFVPAGFTFAIWSVIYVLLILFVVYQWIGSEEKSRINKVSNWFLINGLSNGAWILAWHYGCVFVALVIILILLCSLIMMHKNLNIKYFDGLGIDVFVHVPVSVYLGWISVATIANVTAVLVNYGWSGWGLSEDTYAVVVLIVAIALGCLMMYKHKDIFFAGVITWASYGILSKRTLDTISMDAGIEHTAQVAIYIMILGILLSITVGKLGIKKSK